MPYFNSTRNALPNENGNIDKLLRSPEIVLVNPVFMRLSNGKALLFTLLWLCALRNCFQKSTTILLAAYIPPHCNIWGYEGLEGFEGVEETQETTTARKAQSPRRGEPII
jgi:hypothetical protein